MTPAALLEAAQARRTAETEYRSAVLAAVASFGQAETARTLGVSRQAVAQLVQRAKREQRNKDERAADLETRYAQVLERYTASYTLSTASAITASRNAQARKRRKRGLPPLPTVKSEAMRQGETDLLRDIEAGTVDGFTIIDLETLQGLGAKNEASIPF